MRISALPRAVFALVGSHWYCKRITLLSWDIGCFGCDCLTWSEIDCFPPRVPSHAGIAPAALGAPPSTHSILP
eukprot:333655-Pyramimonas_sp.AAC.1